LRILSKADVQKLMEMHTCIQVNTEAFVAVATGRAKVPVKHHISIEGQSDAVALFMPGYLPDTSALGLKVVSVFPGNQAVGLPTTVGAILLISASTGLPIALMDGTYLTSLRTGAGTGVASKLLARADSKVLTLIGAGGMGYHQIEAVLAVRPIETIRIWNRTLARAEELVHQVQELCTRLRRDVSVAVERDVEAAVSSCDVLVACTAAATPVVLGRWVRPGTHVNLVGAHGADMREGDDELLLKSHVRVVDGLDSALACGELRLPISTGIITRQEFVELGAIAVGAAPGRQKEDEITWFKSVGLAAQDMACAAAVLRRAEQLNVGLEVEL
jgi:ornithine cyclodeaminase